MDNANAASGIAPPQSNPIRTLPYNVDGARAAGFSDDDIVQELQNGGRVPYYDFAGAQKAGFSPTEILNFLAPDTAQPSGYVDQMEQGAADVASGLGKTLDVHSTPGGTVNKVSKWLEAKGQEIAPANFTPADLTGKRGTMSNLGLWLARQSPAALGALGGAVLGTMTAPEWVPAGLAAGAGAGGVGFLESAGNEAQTAADKRTGKPNSPVTPADLTRGDLTAAAENAIGAVPFGRYLPETGVLAKTGTAGAIAALKKLGITAGEQGAANAAADVAHQVGQGVGTPSGVQFNPDEAVAAGVGGAAIGGLLGAPKAVRGTLDAVKYRDITPDLQPAATQVANRVQANAGDANINGRLFFSGGAQRAGEAAVQKTGMDISNELSDAVSDLRSRVNLPTDANNVLKAAQNGQMPTEQGYATLRAAVAGDRQGPNVMNLVQQQHAFDILNDSGNHINGRFTGGLGGIGSHILTGENVTKSGLAALGGAAFEGGASHLINYAPQVLAAVAGARALGRLSDSVTGAQAPAGRFVRNFGSPEAGVRLNVPTTAQAPEEQSPFPNRPMAGGPGTTPMIPPGIRTQMGVRASLAKLQPPQAEPAPAINSLSLPRDITGPASALMRGASAMQKMRSAMQQPASTPETPTNPMMLPATVTTPAKNIMKGAAMAQKVREAQEVATQKAQDAQAAKVAKLASASQAPTVNPTALPASITGPAKNIMRGEVLALKLRNGQQPLTPPTVNNAAVSMARADAAAQRLNTQAVPTSIAKAKDGSLSEKTGGGKRPLAPYSALPTHEAAQRILNDRLAAGIPIADEAAYLAKIHSVLGSLRDKLAAVAKDAPGIPATELARFEGVKSQKAAFDYRDKLAAEYPGAAPVLKKVFSEEAVATQWNAKR